MLHEETQMKKIKMLEKQNIKKNKTNLKVHFLYETVD